MYQPSQAKASPGWDTCRARLAKVSIWAYGCIARGGLGCIVSESGPVQPETEGRSSAEPLSGADLGSIPASVEYCRLVGRAGIGVADLKAADPHPAGCHGDPPEMLDARGGSFLFTGAQRRCLPALRGIPIDTITADLSCARQEGQLE